MKRGDIFIWKGNVIVPFPELSYRRVRSASRHFVQVADVACDLIWNGIHIPRGSRILVDDRRSEFSTGLLGYKGEAVITSGGETRFHFWRSRHRVEDALVEGEIDLSNTLAALMTEECYL